MGQKETATKQRDQETQKQQRPRTRHLELKRKHTPGGTGGQQSETLAAWTVAGSAHWEEEAVLRGGKVLGREPCQRQHC